MTSKSQRIKAQTRLCLFVVCDIEIEQLRPINGTNPRRTPGPRPAGSQGTGTDRVGNGLARLEGWERPGLQQLVWTSPPTHPQDAAAPAAGTGPVQLPAKRSWDCESWNICCFRVPGREIPSFSSPPPSPAWVKDQKPVESEETRLRAHKEVCKGSPPVLTLAYAVANGSAAPSRPPAPSVETVQRKTEQGENIHRPSSKLSEQTGMEENGSSLSWDQRPLSAS